MSTSTPTILQSPLALPSPTYTAHSQRPLVPMSLNLPEQPSSKAVGSGIETTTPKHLKRLSLLSPRPPSLDFAGSLKGSSESVARPSTPRRVPAKGARSSILYSPNIVSSAPVSAGYGDPAAWSGSDSLSSPGILSEPRVLKTNPAGGSRSLATQEAGEETVPVEGKKKAQTQTLTEK